MTSQQIVSEHEFLLIKPEHVQNNASPQATKKE